MLRRPCRPPVSRRRRFSEQGSAALCVAPCRWCTRQAEAERRQSLPARVWRLTVLLVAVTRACSCRTLPAQAPAIAAVDGPSTFRLRKDATRDILTKVRVAFLLQPRNTSNRGQILTPFMCGRVPMFMFGRASLAAFATRSTPRCSRQWRRRGGQACSRRTTVPRQRA